MSNVDALKYCTLFIYFFLNEKRNFLFVDYSYVHFILSCFNMKGRNEVVFLIVQYHLLHRYMIKIGEEDKKKENPSNTTYVVVLD